MNNEKKPEPLCKHCGKPESEHFIEAPIIDVRDQQFIFQPPRFVIASHVGDLYCTKLGVNKFEPVSEPPSEEKREPGFYHVEMIDHVNWWTIAEWDGERWQVTGDEDYYLDKHFAEIGMRVSAPSAGDKEPAIDRLPTEYEYYKAIREYDDSEGIKSKSSYADGIRWCIQWYQTICAGASAQPLTEGQTVTEERWISVKDRLPEKGIKVLGRNSHVESYTDTFHNGHNFIGNKNDGDGDGDYSVSIDITHWMSLPGAGASAKQVVPKEEQDNG